MTGFIDQLAVTPFDHKIWIQDGEGHKGGGRTKDMEAKDLIGVHWAFECGFSPKASGVCRGRGFFAVSGIAVGAMADIGRGSFLRVVKVVGAGAYLDGEQLGEILLPNAELPQGISEDDEVEVFISRDSEDRLIATTQFPFAQVGEFALLKVAALEPIGTFLDWGLKKDLFLPPAETTRDLRVGDEVVVYIGLDSKERLVASMKLSDFTESETEDLKAGQKVELLVFGKSDMGFKALIDGRWEGLLFGNEVFQQLRYGDKVEGYVKQIREDGKIDLSLQAGTGAVLIDETAQKIMTALSEGNGFVAVNDKTSAEEVHRLFGVSKKKYKIALGGLYKKRALRVEQDGIYAVTDAATADSKTDKS